MSQSKSSERRREKKEQQVIEELREAVEPHRKSQQDLYHDAGGSRSWDAAGLSQHHHDGEHMRKAFGMRPFVDVLEEAKRADHPVYQYPETFINAVVHLNDAEKWALEDGRMERFADEPESRKRVLRWLQDHPDVLAEMGDGGTEIHGHSEPGQGKTSFMLNYAGIRNLEVNNDTVLWMLTLDEFELTPLLPWTQVLAPEGVDITVEVQPKRYNRPNVEVGLEDVFRHVIRYNSPRDLFEKVVPGGLYAVLPDPKMRKCESIVQAAYNTPDDVDSPAEVTPLYDYAHAVLEVRARDNAYLHRTTMTLDELGDLLPMNPEADANDTSKKVKQWPARHGKARKKGLSLFNMSHSLRRIDEDVLEKERWFATFPKTPAPSSGLAGVEDVPMPNNWMLNKTAGKATLWNSSNYAEVSWPNPYRSTRFNAEISIKYPNRRRKMEGLE